MCSAWQSVLPRQSNSAVEQSRLQVQNGVTQIFNGRLKVPIQAPNNRLGLAANTGAGAGGTSTATTTGA